jgi:MFS family permease
MRWRILALLFLARIGLGFQFQTLASVGDDLVVAFGLDYAGLGLLIGLFMAPGLVLTLPAGYLGRRVSDREMVVFGLGTLALGGVISSLATSGVSVGIGRAIAGVGFLFANLYFTKMVADWFDGREIATAMSVLVMSWPFGIAMGQIGHAWLVDAFGWQLPFRIASAYCLLAGFAVLVLYRAPDKPRDTNASGNTRLTGQEWRLILCAAGAWGLFNSAYIIYLSFGPIVLQSLGLTAIAAAGVISIASWIMIGSGAVCGQIVDRFGRRNLVMTICMAGAVLALWLFSLPGAGLAASLLLGLVGMAPAGVIMALSGLALRPQVRALGMGVFFTVYFACMMATPPAAGALLDATGDAFAPIWLAIAMFACVVPLVFAFQAIRNGAGVAPQKAPL